MAITLELQQLVFGDRNTFIFQKDNRIGTESLLVKDVTDFLLELGNHDYAISNPASLFTLTSSEFDEFKKQLTTLIESNTKSGIIFRKTFANEERFAPFTDEEWLAILAQYSITYGWEAEFKDHVSAVNAVTILDDYVGSFDLTTVNALSLKSKIFTIGDADTLTGIVKNILKSRTVLRAQQIKTLEATPTEILMSAARRAEGIPIKETAIKVMKILTDRGETLDFPLLKTATDVLRYIVAVHAHEPFEGQITKSILQGMKICIPTSARKMLLNQLELMAHEYKGGGRTQFLCEDMFTFSSFWKTIDRYLRYESAKKTRAKYPLYTSAIDLLYEDDRSWTFNGRYSAAKEAFDYDTAIRVASERPGFLLRNLVEFVRMTKGTMLPIKSGSGKSSAFQNALEGSSKNVVKYDAMDFILSDDFKDMLLTMNTKLGWQLVEQLKDASLFEDVYERNVQGKDISYSTPVPAVKKKNAKKVRKIILATLKSKLKDRNKNVKLFLDDDSHGYKFQYSGRSSTEINYAGEALTPGTELNIDDLLEKADKEKRMLRLGIMWRGQSTDLDHSVTLDTGHCVYYGNPTLGTSENILITSSGDITSCSRDGKFSTELVDIDLKKLKKTGCKSLFNSFIVFSGGRSVGELECYVFFSFINKTDRIMSGNRVDVDLAKQDYAVRVDPDNVDNTGSYIGCQLDLEKNVIKVLAIPVTVSGKYTNAKTNLSSFASAIKNAKIHGLTIGYALDKVFPDQVPVSEATLVISKKTREELGLVDDVKLLHPGRNQEEINTVLF